MGEKSDGCVSHWLSAARGERRDASQSIIWDIGREFAIEKVVKELETSYVVVVVWDQEKIKNQNQLPITVGVDNKPVHEPVIYIIGPGVWLNLV